MPTQTDINNTTPDPGIAPTNAVTIPVAPAAPKLPPATPSAHIDIASILLPKKEMREAQRINAGALLAQEVTAGAQGVAAAQQTVDTATQTAIPREGAATPIQPAVVPEITAAPQSQAIQGQVPPTVMQPVSPQPLTVPQQIAPQTTPAEASKVVPLETYQSDIEKIIQQKNVSTITIAAAEAEKRASSGTQDEQNAAKAEQNAKILAATKRAALIFFGVALVSVSLGLLAYLILRPTTVSVTSATQAPFISVDNTIVMPATQDILTRGGLMAALENAKNSTSLALGLVDWIAPVIPATSTNSLPQTMSAQTFLGTLALHIPATLLRNIEPTFLLGIHSYDGNQPFLILTVDSYEQAYSDMLAWELSMKDDLSPLFAYVPRIHIPEENLGTGSPTTTSQFLQTPFVDKVLENHDTRVILNSTGDVYFLWTFLDRNTIVITTNQYTLREIISRIKQAPVVAVPGQ